MQPPSGTLHQHASAADEDGITYLADGTVLVPKRLLSLVPGLQPAAAADAADQEMNDAVDECEEEEGDADAEKKE